VGGVKAAGLLVFLRVVLGNVVRSGGVFVVSLWWIAWQTWCAEWWFLGAEKHANFLKIIFLRFRPMRNRAYDLSQEALWILR
jgi:hypothetical protein